MHGEGVPPGFAGLDDKMVLVPSLTAFSKPSLLIRP